MMHNKQRTVMKWNFFASQRALIAMPKRQQMRLKCEKLSGTIGGAGRLVLRSTAGRWADVFTMTSEHNSSLLFQSTKTHSQSTNSKRINGKNTAASNVVLQSRATTRLTTMAGTQSRAIDTRRPRFYTWEAKGIFLVITPDTHKWAWAMGERRRKSLHQKNQFKIKKRKNPRNIHVHSHRQLWRWIANWRTRFLIDHFGAHKRNNWNF